jgi:hypothetical protein
MQWEAMVSPKKLVRLLEMTMKGSDPKIAIGRNISKSMSYKSEIRRWPLGSSIQPGIR